MAAPLPVDVTSTWWDYFVDGVGVISGLATAGALLIASLAYRRQVDDARRTQAAMVTVTAGSDTRSSEVTAHNQSNRPIFKVNILVWPVGEKSMRPIASFDEIRAFSLKVVDAKESGWPDIRGARVAFVDGSGHRWFRSTGGEIREMGKRGYVRKARSCVLVKGYVFLWRLRRKS